MTSRRGLCCAALALAALLSACGDAPAVEIPADPMAHVPKAPALRDVGTDAADFRAAFGSGRARLVALVSPI